MSPLRSASWSVTLVASRLDDLFRTYRVPPDVQVEGELRVNQLYHVARDGRDTVLTLTFPTPEYEEEFGECRRYLPGSVTVEADLSGTILPTMLGPAYEELRRRRIVIDAPLHYG